MTDEAPVVRERLADAMDRILDADWFEEFLEDVKGLSKGYSADHTCANCKKRQKVLVQIPDFRQIIQALTELLNQGFGRPGTAEGETGGVTLIIERKWPSADSEG